MDYTAETPLDALAAFEALISAAEAEIANEAPRERGRFIAFQAGVTPASWAPVIAAPKYVAAAGGRRDVIEAVDSAASQRGAAALGELHAAEAAEAVAEERLRALLSDYARKKRRKAAEAFRQADQSARHAEAAQEAARQIAVEVARLRPLAEAGRIPEAEITRLRAQGVGAIKGAERSRRIAAADRDRAEKIRSALSAKIDEARKGLNAARKAVRDARRELYRSC